MYRGSRKHVLDWTNTPEFPVELLQLVAPVDCRLSARSRWMPRGYRSPDEARLETFGPAVWPETEAWSVLRKWWLAHERGANTPNWDIAASCEIDGSQGLILVEAKANVPELSVAGKPTDVGVSAASAENHERIGVSDRRSSCGLAAGVPVNCHQPRLALPTVESSGFRVEVGKCGRTNGSRLSWVLGRRRSR